MTKIIDMTGERCGRLEVIGYAGSRKKSAYWTCKCDCGNTCEVSGQLLRAGKTTSCGCFAKEIHAKQHRTQNGLSNTPLYRVWHGMRTRCNTPSDTNYKYYGAKGVKVCDEWNSSFQAFYNWAMNSGYTKGLSIDRIDCLGDYSPKNCRWITQREQMNNVTTNHKIAYNGEVKTLAEWASEVGIARDTFKARIARGWTPAEAIETPLGGFRR